MDALLTNDGFMPSQYADSRSARALNPVQRLMYAILQDAMRTFQRTRRESLRKDVRKWVEATDDDTIFSFESICTELGVDFRKLRRQVLNGEMQGSPRRSPCSVGMSIK